MRRKDLIIGIIVPILTVIISISGSWWISYHQSKISEQQFYENQLLTRINNMQSVINYCNITGQVHDNLAKARYFWSSRNYTMTEKYLNIVKNDITVRNCFISEIGGVPTWTIGIIIIITLLIVFLIFWSTKKNQKPLEFQT